MSLIPSDLLYPIKAVMTAIHQLDNRLRIVEKREVGTSGTAPPPDGGQETPPTSPTLGAGWTVVPPYSGVTYFRDYGGVVHLQGTVALAVGLPSTMFTLITGHRPTAQLAFQVPTYAIVDITLNGDVIVRQATGYVSLDGINFKAA